MDEWERTLRYHLEYTIPERCKDERHRGIVKRFHLQLVKENKKPATRYRYVEIVGDFLSWIEREKRSLEELRKEDVDDYLNYLLERGVKDLRKPIIVLKKFLKYIGAEEAYNSLKVPKVEEKLPELLTNEEFEKILGKIDDPEYRALIAVLRETGLRLFEARYLKIGDVELDRYGFRLTVRRSKSQPRVVRVVVYKDILARWLELHPARSDPQAFLFPSKRSIYKPVAKNVPGIWLRKAAIAAGVRKRVYPHLLRHMAATELYRYFKPLEMQYWFGWKTSKMIKVYAQLNPSEVEEQYLKARGIIKPEEEKPKTVKCPICGFENSNLSLFCTKCNNPLKKEAVIQAKRGETEDLELLQALKTIATALKKNPNLLEKLLK